MTRPSTLEYTCSCVAICVATLAALIPAGPVLAQTTAPRADESADIIVTARKREESLLEVPVIAQVLGQEQIEQRGLTSVNELSTQVTGLVMGNSTAAFGQQVSIHGIGNTAQSSSIDQSVSLNVDGVQINQGLAYTAGMFDVAQVEVLKGPQALFFGKSSPGGVISLRSADPGNRLEAMLRGGYEFGAKQKRVEGYVSGPVTDTLGLRLAASYSDQDGFFYNNAQPSVTAPGFPGGVDPRHRRYAPQEDIVVRGTAKWEPTDRFSARLKVTWADTRIEGAGGEYQLTDCPEGLTSPSGIPFLAGAECKLDRTITVGEVDPPAIPNVENGGRLFSDNEQWIASLEANLSIGDALTLTSLTGYYDLQHTHLNNGSTSTVVALAAFEELKRRDYTQELRLASDFQGPFNFLIGGFYQDGYILDSYKVRTNAALGLPELLWVLEDGYSEVDIETFSAFAQGRYSLTPELELSLGARYTHEERTQTTFVNYEIINCCILTPGFLDLAVPKISSNNLSPEVNLTYNPTPDTTLFATYKKGFKSGSFNTGPGFAASDQSYDDEKVDAFEAGFKGRLLDRQLVLAVTGYYYDYKDLQVGAIETQQAGSFSFQTRNAASARIYGVDFDLTYQPRAVPGLRLGLAVNYNHARFRDFDNAPCYTGQTVALGCNLNFVASADQANPGAGVVADPAGTGLLGYYTATSLSGLPLVRAPDWSGTVSADYERELGNGMTLGLGANMYFSDDFYTAPVDKESVIQDGFVKLGANIALRGRDDRWEIALIGTNLTNKITAGDSSVANITGGSGLFVPEIKGGSISGPAGIGETVSRPEVGRAVWIRGTIKFGT